MLRLFFGSIPAPTPSFATDLPLPSAMLRMETYGNHATEKSYSLHRRQRTISLHSKIHAGDARVPCAHCEQRPRSDRDVSTLWRHRPGSYLFSHSRDVWSGGHPGSLNTCV